jgi:prolyl oligopeptidase PreP (S9A serine peptidase family)
MKKTLITSLTVALFALVVAQFAATAQQPIQYPNTRKVDQVDTYHGTAVADPYRWLEDDNSEETAKWVEEENRVTFEYLEKIPYRAKIKGRLEQLYKYPKISAPFRKGDLYFFYKNDGLQNQSALYVQTGLGGKPEVLIDPNEWSEDGTTRLGAFALSKDGKYAAYGVSRGGSDWQEYHVMEVASRTILPDTLQWVKVSGMAWQGDGFYYSRYPEPQKGRELSTKNENHQVYYHKVGTAQSEDELVYQDPAHPQRFHIVETTEDERFAILNVSDHGTGKKGDALFYRDAKSGDKAFKPMFLVYKKGLKLDGNNPTLLYAYGGFNVTQSPTFSALRVAMLENGFVYASANLRGGGEYGEKWHEAGTKLKKQNVFDDFIAAAEWLIANKYTSSEKLAIQGGSNGGLLVGAVMNQRPELFKVALPAVGVMDMLRFHKFTIGWSWIADYGSSDNADEFKALYAYSPLHNIKEAKYPATLITTADHDDRVVPAHSFKYAATIQEKQRGSAPVLIRVETKSGHGASSTAKQLEITADTYAFLFHNLGVTPK